MPVNIPKKNAGIMFDEDPPWELTEQITPEPLPEELEERSDLVQHYHDAQENRFQFRHR